MHCSVREDNQQEGRLPTVSNILETLPGRTRPCDYDWDLWLDGRVHELVEGEDYTVRVERMRAMAFTQAKRIGVPLATRRTECGLAIQANRSREMPTW